MVPMFFMPKMIIIANPRNSMLVQMMLRIDVCLMPMMLMTLLSTIIMNAKSIFSSMPTIADKYPPNPSATVAALMNPVAMTNMPMIQAMFLLNAFLT